MGSSSSRRGAVLLALFISLLLIKTCTRITGRGKMLSTDGNVVALALPTAQTIGRPPDPDIDMENSSEQDVGKEDQNLNAQKSYRTALFGQSSGVNSKGSIWAYVGENDMISSTYNGEPELRISDRLREKLCAPWKKTLVIRLLGRSISYSYICSQLRWKWRPIGRMDIIDLNSELFLVTLDDDQDYLKALTGGPWVILDHYLIVQQWSPSFRISNHLPRKLVAWVQLPGLPVQFYHREVLFSLGNLIGRSIKLDYHTEHMQRGKFARIAIEIDMSKPLVPRIRLDGCWQAVVYENLPSVCFQCGMIGHDENSCNISTAQENTAHGSDLTVRAIGSTETIPVDPDQSDTSPGFGPWMQVSRRSWMSGRKPSPVTGQNKERPIKISEDQEISMQKKESRAKNGKVDLEGHSPNKGKQDQRKDLKKTAQNEKKKVEPATISTGGEDKRKPYQQVWKPVEEKKSKEPLGDEVGQDMGPSIEHQNPESLDLAHDKAAILPEDQSPVATKLIMGGNGTKIHVIEVPALGAHNKENDHPNLGEHAARNHGRKKNERSTPDKDKTRGLALRQIKKPLQVGGQKKSTLKKIKSPSFPINLQDLEVLLKSMNTTGFSPGGAAEEKASSSHSEVPGAMTTLLLEADSRRVTAGGAGDLPRQGFLGPCEL